MKQKWEFFWLFNRNGTCFQMEIIFFQSKSFFFDRNAFLMKKMDERREKINCRIHLPKPVAIFRSTHKSWYELANAVFCCWCCCCWWPRSMFVWLALHYGANDIRKILPNVKWKTIHAKKKTNPSWKKKRSIAQKNGHE